MNRMALKTWQSIFLNRIVLNRHFARNLIIGKLSCRRASSTQPGIMNRIRLARVRDDAMLVATCIVSAISVGRISVPTRGEVATEEYPTSKKRNSAQWNTNAEANFGASA